MSRFFSIDDILAEDERMPLKWLSDAVGVGYLDPSNGSDDVSSGSTMELPFWLAEVLKGKGHVDMSLPAVYSRKSRADIMADAVSARLREKSPFFYLVGLRLGPLLSSGVEAAALSKDVHQTLADRAAGILRTAKSGLGEDVSRYRNLLTDLEQQIFDSASSFTASRLAWRREEASMMRPPAATLPGGGGDGAGQTTSAEAGLLHAATMPVSRGQKRQRSILTTSGL
jgi:GINS complex subunit 3